MKASTRYQALRELRLWHWTHALYERKRAENYGPLAAAMHNASADFHIKQVQLLNDFFPMGDTAERDAAK